MEKKPLRILLIEDNPADVGLIREILEAEGLKSKLKITHEKRLSSALERLSEGPFDLVFLDLFLPDSKGVETFEKVRGVAPNTPIVAMTGLDDDDIGQNLLHLGADRYLDKGSDLEGNVLNEIVSAAMHLDPGGKFPVVGRLPDHSSG